MVGLVAPPLRPTPSGIGRISQQRERVRGRVSAGSDHILNVRERRDPCESERRESANLFQLHDFRVGTWNVQGGLHSGFDFDRVVADLVKLKVQVACLQETHCQQGSSAEREGGKVICLEESSPDTPTAQRYGLGFFVCTALVPHILDFRRVSNRIVILRLESPYGGNRNRTFNTICFVNVYAPTSQFSAKHPEEFLEFYRMLNTVVTDCKQNSAVVIVAGDFNSKLGLCGKNEEKVSEAFMGNFGKGTRNRNGGYFASFLEAQSLYATNTHFQHSCRHRTTWNGRIANSCGEMLHVFNQIDYVLVMQSFKKSSLIQARSYHGHEFSSYHGIVVTQMNLNTIYHIRRCFVQKSDSDIDNSNLNTNCIPSITRQPRQLGQQVDISCFTKSKIFSNKYQGHLMDTLTAKSVETSSSSEELIESLKNSIKDAATKTLLKRPRLLDRRINFFEDQQLREWSEEQKRLRMKLLSVRLVRKDKKVREIRKGRTKLFNLIADRIKRLRCENLDSLAEELENTQNSRRVFAIHRMFRNLNFSPFSLTGDNGNTIHSPGQLIGLVSEYYKSFFNPINIQPVDPWGYSEGTLINHITKYEVEVAMSRSKIIMDEQLVLMD